MLCFDVLSKGVGFLPVTEIGTGLQSPVPELAPAYLGICALRKKSSLICSF